MLVYSNTEQFAIKKGLVNLEPAILSAPTIVTLPRYSNPPTDFANNYLSLGQENLSLTRVVDDLLDEGHILLVADTALRYLSPST